MGGATISIHERKWAQRCAWVVFSIGAAVLGGLSPVAANSAVPANSLKELIELANVSASTKYGGTVAACGLAQGMDLPLTVAPFILRGVVLAGVDSVMAPLKKREAAWNRIEKMVDRSRLKSLSREIGLEEAIAVAPDVLAGKVKGGLVVNVGR